MLARLPIRATARICHQCAQVDGHRAGSNLFRLRLAQGLGRALQAQWPDGLNGLGGQSQFVFDAGD